jgi:hypothetical protein
VVTPEYEAASSTLLVFRKNNHMWSTLPSQQRFHEDRRSWLDEVHLKVRTHHQKLTLSSHSLLLQIDIERAFCAGAWLSVIVLSQASIEATLRQIVANDYESNSFELFGSVADLHWLRELRNEILHAKEPGTRSQLWKIDGHDVPICHAALEPEAKRAVELAYKALYLGAEA